MIFFLRLFHLTKICLGIESDTPYKKTGILKNIIKRFIFSRKFVFGFAGGYYSHKDYFKKNGMDVSNIFVLPMVVNNKKFDVNTTNIIKQTKFFFIGKFYERKNIKFLLKAFTKARNINKHIELHLIGDGEQYESLRKKYALSDYLYFYGDVKNHELGKIIKNFHYLILPSKSEPWGLVVNESFASGKLVIASSEVGCIKDFNIIFKDWMIFDPFDLASLCNSILTAASYSNYSKNAESAAKFIAEKWNYLHYEKNFKSSINSIISSNL